MSEPSGVATRAALAHLIVPPHTGESGVAGRVRLERVARVARLLVAVLVLVFGQALPNVGPVFVITLGVFCLGYGLILSRIWSRVRTVDDVEWAERLALTADISLVGFALLVFAPDPSWAVYSFGFLVIASGGFRFRNGALLAAASLSLTYVVVTIFRATALDIDVAGTQVALHLGSYIAGGALMNAVLPELDTIRRREVDLYEPILQAQEDTGEALLLTEDDRPVHWNKTFEELSGYSTEDLDSGPSASEIITVAPVDGNAEHAETPRRGEVHTRDGRSLPVEISRPPVSTADERRSIWIIRDVSERTQAEAELRDRALHDSLTGLPNRALLGDRLAAAIAAAHRQHAKLSVLLIDLNGFKQVNDGLGHSAGDRVLIETAKRLTASLRESDTAARLGGDEFVVLLPATAIGGAIETAWSLNEAIARPIALGEASRAVSASIGIAVFPDHAGDATSLLAAADAAMYEAKRSSAAWRSYDQLAAIP